MKFKKTILKYRGVKAENIPEPEFGLRWSRWWTLGRNEPKKCDGKPRDSKSARQHIGDAKNQIFP